MTNISCMIAELRAGTWVDYNECHKNTCKLLSSPVWNSYPGSEPDEDIKNIKKLGTSKLKDTTRFHKDGTLKILKLEFFAYLFVALFQEAHFRKG